MKAIYGIYGTDDKIFEKRYTCADGTLSFVHVMSGSGSCVTQKGVYDLKKDTFCIIDGGYMKISGAEDGKLEMRGVSVNRTFFERLLNMYDEEKSGLWRSLTESGMIRKELLPWQTEKLNGIFGFLSENSEQKSLKVLSKLIELLAFFTDEDEKDITKNVFLRDELVIEVLNYVNNHVFENMTIEDMAKDLFVSKRYLLYKFKEVTGSTVKKYIYTKRMERAREMLEETDYGISEISAKVGYVTVSGFSRAFRAFSGETPKRYREKITDKKYNER